MTTLSELIKQKEALESQIEATRKAEISDAMAKVKALVAEHGLKASDIFKSVKTANKSSGRSKVAAKYYDPSSGNSWSGRGKEPKWIQGKDRSTFKVA
jgi:DNA-binding protein H-NS